MLFLTGIQTSHARKAINIVSLSLSPGYCLTLNAVTNWLSPSVLLLCDCLMLSWEMTHSRMNGEIESVLGYNAQG